MATISALECGGLQSCKKGNRLLLRSLEGLRQIKPLIIRHPESNCDRLFFFFNFLVFCYLRKSRDDASHLRFDRAKEMQPNWPSPFTKSRVSILPLPVPHTSPPLNSLPTHSFPLPLFVSWEDTSLEKPLKRLFKSLCVAGWQRTPLCFFSHLENLSEIEKRVLSSLPEDPPL